MRGMTRFALLCLMCGFWFTMPGLAQQRWAADLVEPLDYVPGEVLVKFRPGTPPGLMNQALQHLAARHVKTFPRINVQHWRAGRGITTEKALAILSRPPYRDLVEYAEPNYIVHTYQQYPADPLRGDQWALHNIGQTGGTKGADMHALETWGYQNGAPPLVAVIDTGVDYNHPDLAANLWADSDGTHGWDFVNNDNDPMDDNGHGTHVSGTIGARSNNGTGVVGVSWQVRIMAVKFLNASGSGTDAAAISAIQYATAHGARIMNASWGGGRRSQALYDAIAACNCLFVAAAGNGATSKTQYPAGYDLENIVSVAATDHNDALASFSNYSPSWVDLGAPGVSILSTYRGNTYATMSGTSMAAPHVSGTAALLLANNLGPDPNRPCPMCAVKDLILNTVDPLPSLQGKTLKGGRLNAGRAIGAQPLPTDNLGPDPVQLASGGTSQHSITLSWKASGDDGQEGQAYLYDLRYSTSPITAEDFASATPATGEPLPQPAGASETYTLGNLDAGTTYYFALKVADEAGNYSPFAFPLMASTLAGPRWVVEVVPDSLGRATSYNALDFGPDGNPAIAYSLTAKRTDLVRFAKKTGASWQFSTADQGSPGIDLAFDLQGNPVISHGWGRLRFAQSFNGGTSWQVQIVESSNAYNDSTSLVFDLNGYPSIAYYFTANNYALKLARWNGSSWVLEVVHAGAAARYKSLAYDRDGNPAIAYSDDVDGDGWLDSLRFAHWNGSSWDIELVDSGTIGYGVFASLAYDPATGYPTIAHGGPEVHFWVWNGSEWILDHVIAGTDPFLAYEPITGRATISYKSGQQLWWTARNQNGWESEVIDRNADNNGGHLKFDSAGKPSVSYYDWLTRTLRFARREP